MGKIWMKTKYDYGMKMDIPHSTNIAQAMYGFLELGAEIVPYHDIYDILDHVENDDIVLDYIDQCNTVFAKFGVTPYVSDYPDSLKPFLGRKIWKDTIQSIASDEKKWRAGFFVKPVKSKVFTGKIIASIKDLEGCGSSFENYEVYVSDPVEIVAEWRCFLYYDTILDIRPYGLLKDEAKRGYPYHYDSAVVNTMLEAFKTWNERPMACSMDIGVTKDNKTILIEANDAYALGCYGLTSIYYAKFISARWSQLLHHKDEYKY